MAVKVKAKPVKSVKRNSNGHRANGLAAFRPQRMNANRHKPFGLKLVSESIQRDGYSAPMVAAADGELFIGSLRHEAVSDVLPAKPIIVRSRGDRPIIVVREDIPSTDDPRARRLGVADNALAHMDYNPDGEILAALAAEDEILKQVIEADDLSLRAVQEFAASEPLDAEPQMDRAEELRKKWKVKTGQLWTLGEHRLVCGDCTDRAVVERVMNKKKAALILTSPPYFVGKDYEQQKTEDEIISFIELVSKALFEIADIRRRIVINCATTPWSHIGGKVDYRLNLDWWQNSFRKLGWLTRSIRIWSKHGGLLHRGPETDPVDMHWEYLATFWNPGGKPFRGQNRVNDAWGFLGIWDGIQHANQNEHSAPFPLEIPSRFIRLYSDELEIVFEPFAGSGTTLIACENLNRRCRAIEISPGYCAVILQRYLDATGKMPELLD